MDDARAKELLAREREQIEQAIRTAQRGGAENGGTGVEQGDFDPEDLYMGQMDAAQLAELKERLEAVERAEKRLAPLTPVRPRRALRLPGAVPAALSPSTGHGMTQGSESKWQ